MSNREKRSFGEDKQHYSNEQEENDAFHRDPVIAAFLNPTPEEQRLQDEWAQNVRELMGISSTDAPVHDPGKTFSLELRISSLEKENAALSDGIKELRNENSWLRQDVIPALKSRIEEQKAELVKLRPKQEDVIEANSGNKGVVFDDHSPRKIDENIKPKSNPDSFSKQNEKTEDDDVKEHSAMLVAFLERHKTMLDREGKKPMPEELAESVFKIYEENVDLNKRHGEDAVLQMRISALSYFKKIINGDLQLGTDESRVILELTDYIVKNLGKEFINTALVVAKSEHAEFMKNRIKKR